MTLTNWAYLEIDDGATTAQFDLNIGLDMTSAITKSYIMGERGQYVRELYNQAPLTGDFDADRRTGFWIDGGAGNWQVTINFETGAEDVTWGDGSGGTGQANVTKTDASGAGVAAIARLQVLQYWLAKTRTDSQGLARIHWGEWTDGSVPNSSGGVFGQPMPVAIEDTNFQKQPDEPTSMTGTLTCAHVDVFGGFDAPNWLDDLTGAIVDAAEDIFDY